MPGPPELDVDWLSGWIEPSHLSDASIAQHRRAFEQHPGAVLVIPSFLLPARADALSEFLQHEAIFAREYGLHSARHPVSREEWLAAVDGDRFYQMGVLSGVRPDFRLSPNLLAHLKFERVIRDPRFMTLLELMTGFELARPRVTVHGMTTGDYLLSHTDEIDDRKIGFVFYLSRTWHESYGGVLKLYTETGSCNFVPAFNSLALFDVTRQIEHEVTAISDAAGAAARLTISGWIGDRAIAVP
jgi:hypothetical protein